MMMTPKFISLATFITLQPGTNNIHDSLARCGTILAAAGSRESWMEADSATILGRSRSPAKDALSDEDDYTVLDLEVISRAAAAIRARSQQLSLSEGSEKTGDEKTGGEKADADQLAARGIALQSARRGAEAERTLLEALALSRSCGVCIGRDRSLRLRLIYIYISLPLLPPAASC